MFIRFATVAMLALSLLATAGSAQTAAQLLQKGIYAQQTAGDVDGAIKIYQQVIGMAGVDHAIAARAQMQIVSAFLQKGDLPRAAREFTTLKLTYADQKEVVSAAATAVQLAAHASSAHPTTSVQPIPKVQPIPGAQTISSTPRLTKGTLANGVYRHTATGTELRVPTGWSITGDGPSSGGGECVFLDDSSGQSYFVWLMSDPVSAAEIPATLQHDADRKLLQRTGEGVQDFGVRPGTLLKFLNGTAREGGTRQAVALAFDFVQGKTPMIEHGTWVRTEKTFAYFRAFCPVASDSSVQAGMQMLVHATDLP
jgi:hypothetical protein